MSVQCTRVKRLGPDQRRKLLRLLRLSLGSMPPEVLHRHGADRRSQLRRKELVMSKQITVPKGKDYVSIAASGHKYIRILDAEGNEIFRSNSPAESVTAVLDPGSYTVESDGRIGKVDYG